MADPLASGLDPASGGPGADLAKLYGEGTRCPSCGAFARVIATPDHRWMCGICGAPRIVMPEGEALPSEAEIALAEAATAQRQGGLQSLMMVLMGVPAAIALLLAVVLGLASLLAAGVLVAAGVGLAILASRASRRAGTERKRYRGAVERAYESAIAALMTKNRSPAEVAAALRIPEADVEAALALTAPIRARVAAPVRVDDHEQEQEQDDRDEDEHEHEGKA